MGTLYYAVNIETKQAYELGKGAWFALCDGTTHFSDCSDREKVLARVTGVIRAGGWTEEVQVDTRYHERIADALVRLGPRVKIVDDASCLKPLDGLELIGSRYMDRPIVWRVPKDESEIAPHARPYIG